MLQDYTITNEQILSAIVTVIREESLDHHDKVVQGIIEGIANILKLHCWVVMYYFPELYNFVEMSWMIIRKKVSKIIIIPQAIQLFVHTD